MNAEELEMAELVYQDMIPPRSFGYFKRTTEDLIGRTLEPTEAQAAYGYVGVMPVPPMESGASTRTSVGLARKRNQNPRRGRS